MPTAPTRRPSRLRRPRRSRTTPGEPRRPRYQLPAPEDPTGSGLFRPNRRLLWGLLAALIVVAVVRGVSGSHSAGSGDFAKSCTTPAFELSATRVRPGQSVSATVTGPVGGAYLLALDASTATAMTDSVVLAPTTAADLLSKPTLPGCEETTGLLVPVGTSPGQHRVGLFRTRPGDSGGPVQTVTITVS